MRGGVAGYAEGGGIVLLEELEGDVFVERCGEADDAFGGGGGAGVHGLFGGFEGGLVGVGGDGGERADAGDDDGGGEARGDAVGDVEGCCAAGDFADGTVRKLDLDWIAHLTRIVHGARRERAFDTMAEVPGTRCGAGVSPGNDLVQTRCTRDFPDA